MDKFRACTVVTIPAGVRLDLTRAQALARAHALQKDGKTGNVYTTTRPVQIKIGEEFGYDGELPKSLAEAVDAVPAVKKPTAEQTDQKGPESDSQGSGE